MLKITSRVWLLVFHYGLKTVLVSILQLLTHSFCIVNLSRFSCLLLRRGDFKVSCLSVQCQRGLVWPSLLSFDSKLTGNTYPISVFFFICLSLRGFLSFYANKYLKCFGLELVGSFYRLQYCRWKRAHTSVLPWDSKWVSPSSIEGSSYMRLWLLEVVPVVECTASVLC